MFPRFPFPAPAGITLPQWLQHRSRAAGRLCPGDSGRGGRTRQHRRPGALGRRGHRGRTRQRTDLPAGPVCTVDNTARPRQPARSSQTDEGRFLACRSGFVDELFARTRGDGHRPVVAWKSASWANTATACHRCRRHHPPVGRAPAADRHYNLATGTARGRTGMAASPLADLPPSARSCARRRHSGRRRRRRAPGAGAAVSPAPCIGGRAWRERSGSAPRPLLAAGSTASSR